MTSETSEAALAASLDALLPQTECRRCGFSRCLLYAEAIARGKAKPNRCPVGGDELASRLALAAGLPAEPLDPEYGPARERCRAAIRPAECIGCGRCIKSCPTDAVIGAPKRMHAVIAEVCSGCGLCLEACPVDCIELVPTGTAWTKGDADRTRARHASHRARAERDEREARERYESLGESDAVRKKKALAALLALKRR